MSEAVMRQSAAPAPSLRWLWALLTITLFLVGAIGGVLIKDVIIPPPPPNPYGSMPQTIEPTASAELAAILVADNPRRLAEYVRDPELMQALGQALNPIEELFEGRFAGAVEKSGDVLAGYVFTGRVGGIGTETVAVGIIFTVRDGQIIGVN